MLLHCYRSRSEKWKIQRSLHVWKMCPIRNICWFGFSLSTCSILEILDSLQFQKFMNHQSGESHWSSYYSRDSVELVQSHYILQAFRSQAVLVRWYWSLHSTYFLEVYWLMVSPPRSYGPSQPHSLGLDVEHEL